MQEIEIERYKTEYYKEKIKIPDSKYCFLIGGDSEYSSYKNYYAGFISKNYFRDKPNTNSFVNITINNHYGDRTIESKFYNSVAGYKKHYIIEFCNNNKFVKVIEAEEFFKVLKEFQSDLNNTLSSEIISPCYSEIEPYKLN